jgi:hypothetical protein
MTEPEATIGLAGASEGHPGYQLAKYLEAWKAADWAGMECYASKSWRNSVRVQARQTSLMNIHGGRLSEVVKVKYHFLNPVAFRALVTAKVQVARGVTAVRDFDIHVLCENADLLPDPAGEWGVEPRTFQK